MRSVLWTLGRRGWVLLVAMAVCGAAAYAIDRRETGRATADATLVVATQAPSLPTGGNAAEANKLAQTYAALVGEDGVVLDALTAATGRAPGDTGGLTVSNDQDTGIVRVRYSDDSDARALAGTRAVVLAVTSGVARTSAIPPGSLRVVTAPKIVAGTTRGARWAPIAVGVALGLLLGIVLLIAWDRADPRVRDPEALADELGCPVLSLSDLSQDSTAALVDRWRAQSGSRSPTVALVAGTASVEERMPGLAERIVAAAGAGADSDEGGASAGGLRLANGAGPGSAVGAVDREVVLVVAGKPGGEAAGEGVASTADLVVLAVPERARAADLRSSADLLHDFGADPAWGIFVPAGRFGEAAPAE